ncbi:MAG: NADPH:quinone reductase [Gemmataceae bacterium]|nr:NADPH:quinone reductase [Gemmataceae bacterium]
MKAALLDSPGPASNIRYGDIADPTPKGNEIVVRVAAASLNPIDVYVRAGTIPVNLPKPFITGSDVAGSVVAAGPDAKRYKPGDRVWASNMGLQGRQGSCAELVCSSEEWFYPIPAGVTETDAAAAALVGITAHLGLLTRSGLKAGEIAFVNGGTGGVGSMVVQMAKAVGAKVIATVGSEEKAALCKSWGADLVMNYKTDDVVEGIKKFTAPRGLDVWFETQREPDFLKMIPLMAMRGRMIVMAGRTAQPAIPTGAFYVKDLTLHGFAMFNASFDEQRKCADDVNRWLAEKKLKPAIGRTFSLKDAAAAHQFLEENTLGGKGTLVGKVLVTP